MTWYKPNTWFRSSESVAETKPKEEDSDGEFSTDLKHYRGMKTQALNTWIERNMYSKTHDDLVVIDAGGKSIAMDSCDGVGMDSGSAKAAYSLSSTSLSQTLFAWYVRQGFIGYQACAIIAQNALVDKACVKPAKKAIKKGYEITVNDGSDVDIATIKALRSFDKRFKIRKNLVEFEKNRRVFGIRIAMFKVKSSDADYYLKPFNLDGIAKGSYKGIVQVDPYWITPELDAESSADPSSLNFYEPTWWRVNGKRYHHTHLIITRYTDVPDVLKPSYIYGGLPLPQLIYERVYAAERTANEAPMLALTKRVNIVKTDTKKVLANQAAFEERMAAFNEFRDNFGILAIGKDEDYQQTDTALSDLDNVIMTQYQLVAALAGMPATELIETSPKGFNATGESEKTSWYDTLETIQEESMAPLVERHYEILLRSEGMVPFSFDVVWNPLDSPTPKEIAETNEVSSRTDTQLQLLGAIDAVEVRDRLISDPISGYSGIAPYDVEEPNDDDNEDKEDKEII